MGRPTDKEFIDAIEAPRVELFYTVELHLEIVVRLWSGIGDMVIDGETYTGAGQIMEVGATSETTDISARGLAVELSSLPSAMLSAALTEEYKGKPLLVHLGTYDAAEAPVRDLLFKGNMDTMVIVDGGDTSTMTLTAESQLIRLERGSNALYTNSYQQERFAGDKGLEFIDALQLTQIVWGAKGTSAINPQLVKTIQSFV